MLRIEENINLQDLNSFRIRACAKQRIIFDDAGELAELFKEQKTNELPFLITGLGTNLLFVGDFNGCLIYPDIQGIEIIQESDSEAIVEAGAGVEWDHLVEWTIGQNLYGLENLSLIPGNTGAAIVQNIGAYGAEIGKLVEEVEVMDLHSGKVFFLKQENCNFSYRNSIFKNEDNSSWIVMKVKLKLSRFPSFNLSYGNLQELVIAAGGPVLAIVRDTVIKIRRDKLPDPEMTGNAGSFFKNPILNRAKVDQLKHEFPGIPFFPAERDGLLKVPAAWLIEKAGWKGYRRRDAGVFHKQALVIINHGSARGKDILQLALDIQTSVKKKFGIILEPEVRIIMNK